jgi:hypothetical protein
MTSGGVSVGGSDTLPASNRFNAGAEYKGHGLTARTEYLYGQEARTERRGYYALLAYRVHPRLELVSRYDVWDPNADGAEILPSRRETDYTGGLTFFVDSSAKLQANYMHKTFEDPALETRNLVIVNAQVAW